MNNTDTSFPALLSGCPGSRVLLLLPVLNKVASLVSCACLSWFLSVFPGGFGIRKHRRLVVSMMQTHHSSLGGSTKSWLARRRVWRVYAPGIPVASGMDLLYLFAVSAPSCLPLQGVPMHSPRVFYKRFSLSSVDALCPKSQ